MKKQLIILGIFGLLLVVCLTGCTQNDPFTGLKYTNKDLGFGLNPPNNWTSY